MDESVEIRVADGRVLAYGMEVDDHLDLDHGTYEVNGCLPQEQFARLCFTAGFRAGSELSKSIYAVPFAGFVGD